MIGKRVALALAWAIAWCGAAAAQMGAPPAQAAGEPLRIGLLLDMSGLYADLNGPGSETAAKMAAEDFGGRVLGRPIEVVAADHSNRADIAVRQGARVVRPGPRHRAHGRGRILGRARGAGGRAQRQPDRRC